MSRRSALRLSRRHRAWLYGSTFLLFATGVAWWALHRWGAVEGEFSTEPHPALPWLLKAHGAAAMIALIVLGTLLPIHVKRSWAAGRNRSSGTSLLIVFFLLTLTGYGLYYVGGEALRAWTSFIHFWIGAALPAVIVGHIWLGRRARRL